jgi:hypothetical protein
MAMADPHDTSVEAQTKRNAGSDMRFALGCQLAMPIMAFLSLLPLGLISLFTNNLAVISGAIAVFNFFLALFAYQWRRRLQEETLGRSIAGWLIIMAPFFALLYALMSISHAFDV